MCILISFLIILSINSINSWPYMVPQESCNNLLPQHNCSSQTTVSPYKIVINKKHFYPGEELKVSLFGENQTQFSGFILQARLIRTNTIVGSWYNDSQLNEYLGFLKCFDKNNSLVHAWPQFYKDPRIFRNITAGWIAPNVDNWDIEFVATVVKNYDVFWSNIKSDIIVPTSRYIFNQSSKIRVCFYCINFFISLIILIQI